MKAVKLIIALWLVGMLLQWASGGKPLSVMDALPYADRSSRLPNIYEWAAVVMVGLGILGYLRLRRRG